MNKPVKSIGHSVAEVDPALLAAKKAGSGITKAEARSRRRATILGAAAMGIFSAVALGHNVANNLGFSDHGGLTEPTLNVSDSTEVETVTPPTTGTYDVKSGQNATVIAQEVGPTLGLDTVAEQDAWAQDIHELNKDGNDYLQPGKATLPAPDATGPLGDQ